MSAITRKLVVEDDPRWAAVLARDAAADGRFFYAVTTTGIYCRPSCASRRPRREHVQFHATRQDAEGAGFRPCRRCRPDQPSVHEQRMQKIVTACRRIETAENLPKLNELARQAGLSPYHFHRLFKCVTGLTPKAFADACRQRRLRAELARDDSVTNALLEAGYNSNSRFYEASKQVLGMTPSDYRNGGSNHSIRFAVGECTLGAILVASSEQGVCAITLGDDPDALIRDLQDRFPQAELVGGDADYEQQVAQVIGLVEAPATGVDLPLDIRGTAFQRRVWQALQELPAGETASYSEIARRIGRPGSARAVAKACAANSLAVAIPCHRVVRNDGGLSGYRWGVERKRELLKREADDERDS